MTKQNPCIKKFFEIYDAETVGAFEKAWDATLDISLQQGKYEKEFEQLKSELVRRGLLYA